MLEELRKALAEMESKARSMEMKGVAVAAVLPKGSDVDWTGEMKVVDKVVNIDDDGKGWNLVAIAWSKVGEVIASGAASGNPDRKCMVGELNFVGGAYDESADYRYAFSFSGGISEDDLIVAKHGIACLKQLLNQ